MVIEECYLGIELSMDRIIEEGSNKLIIIEMTLEEEIVGKCNIIQVCIIELDIETMIEMTILEEVQVGPGKYSIEAILEGMNQSSSNRSRSGLRASTNRDRIRFDVDF